jgi:hypothetical protein
VNATPAPVGTPSSERCPICGEKVRRPWRTTSADAEEIDCTRCGPYRASRTLLTVLKKGEPLSAREGAAVSSAVRKRFQSEGPPTLLADWFEKTRKEAHLPSPDDQGDSMIRLLRSRSSAFGQYVKLDLPGDLSVMGAVDNLGLDLILKELTTEKLIERVDPVRVDAAIRLTKRGWTRSEELLPARADPTPPLSISVSPPEKVWLDELHRRLLAGESVDRRSMMVALRDVLPKGFTPADLNPAFLSMDGLSAIGVLVVDPKSKLLSDLERLIRLLREWLESDPRLTEVSSEKVADAMGVDKLYAARLLELLGTAGPFTSGGSGQKDKGLATIALNREENLAEFLKFGDLQTHLVKEFERQESQRKAPRNPVAVPGAETRSGAVAQNQGADRAKVRPFITWSGDLSGRIALQLREWLPRVLPFVEPWVSPEDIEKGARWGGELATGLQSTDCGIVCLVPNNTGAPWLNFEAGSLSKSVDKARVHPFLLGVQTSDLATSPLGQFQATRFDRDDVRKLVRAINKAAGDSRLSDEDLTRNFRMRWPDLKRRLKPLLAQAVAAPAKTKRTVLAPTAPEKRPGKAASGKAEFVGMFGVKWRRGRTGGPFDRQVYCPCHEPPKVCAAHRVPPDGSVVYYCPGYARNDTTAIRLRDEDGRAVTFNEAFSNLPD